MRKIFLIGVLSLALSNCFKEAYRVPEIDPPVERCDNDKLVYSGTIPANRRTTTNETKAIVSEWEKCAQWFEIQGRKNHEVAKKNRPDDWFEDSIEILILPLSFLIFKGVAQANLLLLLF